MGVVKNPCYSTWETWQHMLRRAPRCLEWTPADYTAMGAQDKIIAAPPHIGTGDLYQMEVGNEPAPERHTGKKDAAVLVLIPGAPGNPELVAAFETAAAPYPVHRTLELRSGAADSPLGLMHHMAVKLALNTISTGTMVKLGRVAGNWMSWVDISNKKLVDRAIRLISELANSRMRRPATRFSTRWRPWRRRTGATGRNPPRSSTPWLESTGNRNASRPEQRNDLVAAMLRGNLRRRPPLPVAPRPRSNRGRSAP